MTGAMEISPTAFAKRRICCVCSFTMSLQRKWVEKASFMWFYRRFIWQYKIGCFEFILSFILSDELVVRKHIWIHVNNILRQTIDVQCFCVFVWTCVNGFVATPTGIEPVLPGWKPSVLTARRRGRKQHLQGAQYASTLISLQEKNCIKIEFVADIC